MKIYPLLFLLTCVSALFCTKSSAYDVLYKGILPEPPPELRISEDTKYSAFASGGGFGLVLLEDGTIDVWGNREGLDMNVISGLENVSAIAAHGYIQSHINALALNKDGTVINLALSHPILSVPDQLRDVKAVDVASSYSIALKNDGSVVVWGHDFDGVLDVPAGLADVIAIAAGGSFVIALKNDGSVVSWGENDYNKLVIPADLSDVIAIDAGSSHAVALKKDGTVVAWGNNDYGQLNIPANLSNVVKISTAGEHTLALKDDGTVVAWGNNEFGQTDVPIDLTDVISVFAGSSHSVIIKKDGSIVGWGDNDYGQFTGSYKRLRGVRKLLVNGDGALALRNDGAVFAWGSPHDFRQSAIAAELTDVVEIATNDYISFALKADGSIVAWDTFRYEPYDHLPNFEDVISISANHFQLVLFRSDGSLEHRNIFSDSDFPAPPLARNVSALTSAYFHSIAIVNPSTAIVWGLQGLQIDQDGLDWGEKFYHERDNVKAVAAGRYHSMFLMKDGTVQIFPLQPFSESSYPLHPLAYLMPNDLSDVTSIATGSFHAVALKQDGEVVAWGENSYGEIDIPSDLTHLLGIAATEWGTIYYFPDGALSGCIVNETILTDPYFPSIGEGFAYGMNSQSYFYTALCPFVYDFGTSGWWYLYEGNINPNAFWIYSYNDASWKFVLSGYVLDL